MQSPALQEVLNKLSPSVLENPLKLKTIPINETRINSFFRLSQ